MTKKDLILRCDGGARGNPGPAGAGMVMEDAETNNVLWKQGIFLGVRTNNQAEYIAVYKGVEKALVMGFKTLHIYVDSELVCKQLNGKYKIKDAKLKEIAYGIMGMLEGFSYVVEHVYREENTAADELANLAMDKGKEVGEAFTLYA